MVCTWSKELVPHPFFKISVKPILIIDYEIEIIYKSNITNLDVVSTVLLQCFVDSISTRLLSYHESANKFPLLNEFTVPFGSFLFDLKDGGKPFRLPMTVPIRAGWEGGGGGGQIAIIFQSQFYFR